MMGKKIIPLLYVLLLLSCLTGCNRQEQPARKEIDFTVCDKTRLPGELVEIIEEKKSKPFKLSYLNNDYMYIVVGYGEVNRQNLKVTVENLYMTDNAIYFETNLISMDEEKNKEPKGEASMYPYIAIKCEKYDLPVVFDVD